jgi:hypothetical protein
MNEKMKEYYKLYKREWRKNNPDKEKIYHKNSISKIRTRNKERRNNNETYRTIINLRRRLHHCYESYSCGKKINSKHLGIDWNKIIEYIGPCPGDRKDYHIDHIKPLCLFDFNDVKQIKLAFAPENHQWLTKEENLKKKKYRRQK